MILFMLFPVLPQLPIHPGSCFTSGFFSRDQTHVLCLQGKHFTDLAISPAPIFAFLVSHRAWPKVKMASAY